MSGMKARYEIGELDFHDMTVEITMEVKEWRSIRKALDQVGSGAGALNELHSLIDRVLRQFDEASSCRWISTPYRTDAED